MHAKNGWLPSSLPATLYYSTTRPKSLAHCVAWILLSVILKRQGIFLLAPLLSTATPPAPSTATRTSTPKSATRWTSIIHQLMRYPLIKVLSGDHVSISHLEGYLSQMDIFFVEANGGLYQQRTSICNAVAVAGYLNATLVIPNFHFHIIWRNPSKSGDIFDEEFFLKTLGHDVRIVRTIPGYMMERFDHNVSNVFNFRIKAWSSINLNHRDTVLPKLLEEK